MAFVETVGAPAIVETIGAAPVVEGIGAAPIVGQAKVLGGGIGAGEPYAAPVEIVGDAVSYVTAAPVTYATAAPVTYASAAPVSYPSGTVTYTSAAPATYASAAPVSYTSAAPVSYTSYAAPTLLQGGLTPMVAPSPFGAGPFQFKADVVVDKPAAPRAVKVAPAKRCGCF